MAFADFPTQEVESGPRANEHTRLPELQASGDINANITGTIYIEPSAGAIFLIPFSFQYRAAPG